MKNVQSQSEIRCEKAAGHALENLNVEAEQRHVAVLHDIILALAADQSLFLSLIHI